jgi:hypothetical protein
MLSPHVPIEADRCRYFCQAADVRPPDLAFSAFSSSI